MRGILVKIASLFRRTPKAIADCEDKNHPGFLLVTRGYQRSTQGDFAGAVADYTRVLSDATAPSWLRSQAINHRGWSKGKLGDFRGAIEDYDAVLAMSGIGFDERASALSNRALANAELGDWAGELADVDTLMTLLKQLSVTGAVRLQTLIVLLRFPMLLSMCDCVFSVIALGQKASLNDWTAAYADCDELLNESSPSTEDRAAILVIRARARLNLGELTGAIADCDDVLQMPNEGEAW